MSPRSGEQTDPCTLVMSPSGTDSAVRHGACLVVIRGGRLGARIELGEAAVVIGRGTEADFQIASRSVSRSHCRVFPRQDGFWVEDLRSTNHTFVNGDTIDQHELVNGDQIRIGESVLKYLEAGNVEAGFLSEMRNNAIRDELTGLYNRRHLMGELANEIARCRDDASATLALAIVDVDRFKDINDRIGHLAGDAVLKQMTSVLNDHVRADDTLARIGGEEFAVMMPETALADAAEVCERLRQAVEAGTCLLDGGEKLTVTVSIGLAVWAQSMTSISDLMKTADERLYEAKSNGRNRVCPGPDPAPDPEPDSI
jgi:two-component system cell cycle response regulator